MFSGPVNWEIGVPNGVYAAVVDFGTSNQQGCMIEGALACARKYTRRPHHNSTHRDISDRSLVRIAGVDCVFNGDLTITDGRKYTRNPYHSVIDTGISKKTALLQVSLPPDTATTSVSTKAIPSQPDCRRV